jgi:hypothetical protein
MSGAKVGSMVLSWTMTGRLVLGLVAGAMVAGGAPALAQANQLVAAQAPAFRQLPTAPELNGVWCAGPNKCLAVGTDRQNAPISMVWNGRHWSYENTPAWPMNGTARTGGPCAPRAQLT